MCVTCFVPIHHRYVADQLTNIYIHLRIWWRHFPFGNRVIACTAQKQREDLKNQDQPKSAILAHLHTKAVENQCSIWVTAIYTHSRGWFVGPSGANRRFFSKCSLNLLRLARINFVFIDYLSRGISISIYDYIL